MFQSKSDNDPRPVANRFIRPKSGVVSIPIFDPSILAFIFLFFFSQIHLGFAGLSSSTAAIFFFFFFFFFLVPAISIWPTHETLGEPGSDSESESEFLRLLLGGVANPMEVPLARHRRSRDRLMRDCEASDGLVMKVEADLRMSFNVLVLQHLKDLSGFIN